MLSQHETGHGFASIISVWNNAHTKPSRRLPQPRLDANGRASYPSPAEATVADFFPSPHVVREIPCFNLTTTPFRLFVLAAPKGFNNDIGLRIAHFLSFDVTNLTAEYHFLFTGRTVASVTHKEFDFFLALFEYKRKEQKQQAATFEQVGSPAGLVRLPRLEKLADRETRIRQDRLAREHQEAIRVHNMDRLPEEPYDPFADFGGPFATRVAWDDDSVFSLAPSSL